jgi:hypothetical protein
MTFLKKIKEKIIINKKNEQVFYELALVEFSTGKKRTGLWAMALSKSDGSIEKANALYIGLLAEEIKNDEYLEANKIQEIERKEKLLELEQEKELNLVQKKREKEMKKLIDPRFKDPQPFLKKKH